MQLVCPILSKQSFLKVQFRIESTMMAKFATIRNLRVLEWIPNIFLTDNKWRFVVTYNAKKVKKSEVAKDRLIDGKSILLFAEIHRWSTKELQNHSWRS